jgi:nucleoside-diphosphate-sugar epimerase
MATLITGVAGLTGSYLAEQCLAAGDEVIGLDNFFRGTRRNLEPLAGHPRFRLVEGDILDIDRLDVPAVDSVFHLAAIVPTRYFYEAPVDTYRVNCHGMKVVLDWALARGARTFVNASSSEIYGHPAEVPTTERTPSTFDAVECTPRWSYALGKLLTEHIGNFHRDRITICHLRYANVYGPRDLDDHHVIPYLIRRVLSGEPVQMSREADTITRSFLYMTDCADATRLAALRSPTGESYNIGSPQEVTLRALAETIFALAGRRVRVDYVLDRPGDPRRRLLDTSKAERMLGCRAAVSLEDGLRETMRWMKRELNA